MNSTTFKQPAKAVGALKVLVVDDDPFQIEFIGDTLRSLGILDITLAASSDQALQAQARFKSSAPFDLLVCDLHMPGKDGFQMMEAMAAAGYRGAVIIASGQESAVLHSASLVAQLRRFKLLGSIQKPVTKSALSELIGKLAS